MYEVKPPAPDDLPALRDIFLEKEGDNTNFLGYDIPYNEAFNVVYTLSNKGKKPLKGKLRLSGNESSNSSQILIDRVLRCRIPPMISNGRMRLVE